MELNRETLLDALNKFQCLLGYLEMWKEGKRPPDELAAVIKEGNDWQLDFCKAILKLPHAS
jgi:hypothetical protein